MVDTSTTTIGVVMGILAWIVLGAVAGIVAEKLIGERIGLVMATVAGIVGALLGGWLAKALFHVRTLDTFFDLSTWVTAIIGAVIVLLALRALNSGRSRRGRSRTRFGF
jgi:uncharacterized membrane protein YeaQ/YmgE (transglycosylase-associated protein family)